MKMATNGAEVKDDGSVVALGPLHTGNMPVVDTKFSSPPNAKRERELEEREKQRTMDILRHDQDDFEV